MANEPHMVSLGFTQQAFPAGVHVCQIFASEGERLHALLEFLRSGLQAGERTACFTEQLDEAHLDRYLAERNLSYGQLKESGTFSNAGTHDVYFQDGRFDPDRILAILAQYHIDSVANGFPAARVIGEMAAEVQHVSGGSRLMEYESRVSLLLKEHPVTAVCQYDARAFDGATIMQVLKVHPLMIIRGTVLHNPFYTPPGEYLARHC